MNGIIAGPGIPNVYERLLTGGQGETCLDIASRLARYDPIYQDDPEWQSVVLEHDDQVFDFLDQGLKVIGILSGGKCVGYFGYRLVSKPQIIIRKNEVVLPFEMRFALDDGLEMDADVVHAAQLYVASQENLKEIVAGAC
jgi:hypothetical protein